MLERAGALARVTADGEPYPEGDPEPVLVEVDGVSYYEAGEAPEVCWLATEDGAAYAEADKPLDRLTDLLSEDAKYATIYERILGLTAQESGASMPTINEAVDNDELLKSPVCTRPTSSTSWRNAMPWNGATRAGALPKSAARDSASWLTS